MCSIRKREVNQEEKGREKALNLGADIENEMDDGDKVTLWQF